MNVEQMLKGLELLGALVTAVSITSLPDEELEKFKARLEQSEQPQLAETQDEKTESELNHDLTSYSDEERAVIEKYLKSLEKADGK